MRNLYYAHLYNWERNITERLLISILVQDEPEKEVERLALVYSGSGFKVNSVKFICTTLNVVLEEI